MSFSHFVVAYFVACSLSILRNGYVPFVILFSKALSHVAEINPKNLRIGHITLSILGVKSHMR